MTKSKWRNNSRRSATWAQPIYHIDYVPPWHPKIFQTNMSIKWLIKSPHLSGHPRKKRVCLKMGTPKWLPSGHLTICYWKWPFIVDLPIKNCDFPQLWKRLPEGKFHRENDALNHDKASKLGYSIDKPWPTCERLQLNTMGGCPSTPRFFKKLHMSPVWTSLILVG
jgi:hypothetical protein